jgi:hypothetical protein
LQPKFRSLLRKCQLQFQLQAELRADWLLPSLEDSDAEHESFRPNASLRQTVNLPAVSRTTMP